MASVAKRRWLSPNGEMKEAWVIRYLDKGGRHRQRTFKLKKDADYCCRQIENELEAGTHVAQREGRPIKEVAADFLKRLNDKVVAGRLRPGTVKNYHTAFRVHIVPEFGGYRINELPWQDVERWYWKLVRKGLSAPSAKRRLVFMKVLFDYAIRRNMASRNPASEALSEVGPTPSPPVRTFQMEDIHRLLEEASGKRYRSRDRASMLLECVVHIGAFCGLRWGEIFGLKVEYLDLEKGWLRVRHSLDGSGILQPPKTKAGNRDVFLPDHLREMLATYIIKYPPHGPDTLVFSSQSFRPMSSANFHRVYWKPLLHRAGLTKKGDDLHFHALRHFAASWMIENGWSLPDVSQALGHSNVSTTLSTYAHVLKSRSQSATAVREAAIRLLAQRAEPPMLTLQPADV